MDSPLEHVANQLSRIERELSALRRELAQFEPPVVQATHPDRAGQVVPWADKRRLRVEFARSLAAQSIAGEPVGALSLQARMAREGLAANELSQAVIAARDA